MRINAVHLETVAKERKRGGSKKYGGGRFLVLATASYSKNRTKHMWMCLIWVGATVG